jgi:hypothetical protein
MRQQHVNHCYDYFYCLSSRDKAGHRWGEKGGERGRGIHDIYMQRYQEGRRGREEAEREVRGEEVEVKRYETS